MVPGMELHPDTVKQEAALPTSSPFLVVWSIGQGWVQAGILPLHPKVKW